MYKEAVPQMLRIIGRGLEAVEARGARSFRSRHSTFRQAVANAEMYDIRVRSLLKAATRSLGFVASSAYRKAVEEDLPQPAHTTRRSTGLLDIATLPNSAETLIMKTDVLRGLAFGPRVLDPQYLEVLPGVPPTIDYTEWYRGKLDRLRINTGGCPVYGQVLDNMFARYVDVVFAHQLERERASATPA